MVPRKFLTTLTLTAGLLLIGPQAVNAQAVGASAAGQFLEKSTPAFTTTAKNLGPENQNQTIDVSLWLNFHNRQDLDTVAEQLYNPSSVNFHRWLTRKDIVAKYAPTAAEAEQVKSYLSSKGLKNITVGPDNFFVRGQGSVGIVQKAFRVQINQYQTKDEVLRANAGDVFIESSVAPLVRSVGGLSSAAFKHHNVSRSGILKKLGKTPLMTSAASLTASEEAFFTSVCFTGVKTESFDTNGGYPAAKYTGNNYYGSPTSPGCGYTPAEIRTAYNLNALYKEGFDGTGQTIVIIDWCGSPTILQDANAFSAKFGLPPLTSSNFKIIEYPTPSTCASEDPEINIDVEWAHAIAPGANITLLVPPGADFPDTDAAQVYAEEYGLGGIISGSYGAEELYVDPLEVINQGLVSEIGAVLGIAVNFSTGDEGDFTFDDPTSNPPSVSVPAASPYATGVGGVTLALNKSNGVAWQAGWGNNETELRYAGSVDNPPTNFGFIYGSGGGSSRIFAKPYYQSKLPGLHRQLPDISWLGDPFTGAIIAITQPGVYPISYEAYGGTSLACPMFAALWAIANQEAGGLLGQAAPYLYSMPATTITDIVSVSSPTNVAGTVYTSPGRWTNYSAAKLASPLEGTTEFYSAFWDYPSLEDTTLVLTFGTDSGLRTARGWDDVTGLGTPNGKAFADYFNPAAVQ